ncbi:DMT family transporter [Candidatus Kaiserbacteria bacterium]|nr:DMT family transporter [Candidatus Kaiserbacteria bacterium]
MLSGAFFFFIAVAILSYGIQGSLQTTFARKYDAFTVVLHRNLSLIVTMAPILLLVTREEIFEVAEHLPILILASSTGAVSILLAQTSSRYLPIGISTSIRQVVQIIIAVLIGVVLLNEWLTPIQLLLLALIVFIGVMLALLRSDHPHLDPTKIWTGIFFTAGAGTVVAFSFYFLGLLSREMNPLVAGYFWEVGVAVFALIYFVILSLFGKVGERISVSMNDRLKIIGISLLTISATSSYAYALSTGPYALAAGLLTATTLVASVMGWVIYKERLTKFQIALIIAGVGLMFLLKLLS